MAGFFDELDTWLTSVEAQKTALAANLTTQGVASADTEAMADLVDKVLDIVIALTLNGNAAVGDVLLGKTFYNTDQATKETGTMPNNGAESTDISAVATEVTISAGYHNGSGKVKIAAAEQAKVIAGNIKDGVTLLGVLGTLAYLDTSDATATADKILSGYTAYVNDVKITGTYEGGVAFNVWGEM